jgi:hypothetical protein
MGNLPRWDGATPRFYEVWYFIFVDRATGDGFWIRYTLLNPLAADPAAGATLWFGYTSAADPDRNLAISRTYQAPAFTIGRDRFAVGIGDATLREGAFAGGFEAHGRRVGWDLTYTPAPTPHYFFGPLLRRVAEWRSSATVPNPQIELEGTVRIDDRMLRVGGPGHQAHHWGSERAPHWLWAHCSAFAEDKRAIVELLAPALPGGVTLTFVTLHTAAGTIACTDAVDLLRNHSSAGLGFWQFTGYHGRTRVVADIRVDPRQVLKFVYTSTDMRPSDCWNTQVGDCLVRVYERASSGETLTQVLRARGTAAAEVHDECPERIAYPAWWRAQPPG